MANIFDYLTDVQYDSFYDLPLNELDVLALTELTYLPFDNLLYQPVNRLSDVATRVPRESTMLTNKERLQLLDQLAQHKRFKSCRRSLLVNMVLSRGTRVATSLKRLTGWSNRLSKGR